MLNFDDPPSYLGNSPQKQEEPSYLQFPKPNTSGNIQPPTTQPSLQNAKVNLPQIDSEKQLLNYSYRAGVSPYFRNMPYQKILGHVGQISENVLPIVTNDKFKEGAISGSLIVGGAVLGYHYEKQIKKRIGAEGYGALFGALSGNAINNVLKARSLGQSQLQALYGGALPMIPLILFGKMKKPLGGKTAYRIGTIAIGYLLYQRFLAK